MPHPVAEPHDRGWLETGDGNRVFFEVAGHLQGKPALVLHGGPGSGCSPRLRTLFDPEHYRIVLFDQRGCGRSTPHASTRDADFATNTTAHLLADIEQLRVHLGIERWLVFGTSWGSTLALAYAETHPERVSELVLAGVTMTRRCEIDWLYGHLSYLLPEAFEGFRCEVPEGGSGVALVDAYWHRLIDPDPAVHRPAAERWCAWEQAVVAVDSRVRPSTRFSDPAFRLAFARLCSHYLRHLAWLEDGVLLRNADQLAGIQGTLAQGRLDLAAPLTTGYELSKVWPRADLVLIDGALHGATEPAMAEAIVAATDAYALDP